MRKVPFVNNEYYHIYNKGVDGRDIFLDECDKERFFKSMMLFNAQDSLGSIRDTEELFQTSDVWEIKKIMEEKEKLIEFISFHLNENHFHFIVEQITDGGTSEFMKRIGGYTKYFNERHQRSGALFQGKFKAVHIHSNPYLLHVSAYVNLNDRVHRVSKPGELPSSPDVRRLGSGVPRSSWEEYIGASDRQICKKDIVLGQFASQDEYKHFAEETLSGILERRYRQEVGEMEHFLLE